MTPASLDCLDTECAHSSPEPRAEDTSGHCYVHLRPILTVAFVYLIGILGVSSCFDFSGLSGGLSGLEPSPCPSCDAGVSDSGLGDDTLSPDSHVDGAEPEVDAGPKLLVLSVEPGIGDSAGGQIVMIRGTGFVQGASVLFGGVPGAKVFVVTGEILTVATPPHPPGLVDVAVENFDGSMAVLDNGFLYETAVKVESVDPAAGIAAGGEPAQVRGQGFAPDCEVFFGTRRGLMPEFVSHDQINVVTPPGGCGPVDVRVVCGEEYAVLLDGFYFDGSPKVYSVEPPVGPAETGFWVELRGSSFTPAMNVWAGSTQVERLTFYSHELVRVFLPSGAPGPVDLALETECGNGLAGDSVIMVQSGSNGSGPGSILGFAPRTLPACAGGILTIVMDSHVDASSLEVFVGGALAQLLSVDEDAGLVRVKVEGHDPGPATVQVMIQGNPIPAEDNLEFKTGMVISSVQPAFGIPEGGDWVDIYGCGLPNGGEVWFGPFLATGFVYEGPTHLRVLTPPGSPGPVDVTVVGPYGFTVRRAGFDYRAATPELYFVDPESGARCGGTFVRFVGSGLPSDGEYALGSSACFDVHEVNSSLVVARMPPLAVGTWPATVLADEPLALENAFTSYDPGNKKGGTSGGPIRDSLNVTVFDNSTGKGLASAFVVLGNDPNTPHKGYTDANGQITFSQPGLRGRFSVTAARMAYTLFSLVDFDATNVSVFLNSTVPAETSGGGGQPSQAWVTGRVSGMDKYVPIPPGNCANKTITGIQCRSCEADADCPADPDGPPAHCTLIGKTGRWCTVECEAPEDCGEGFVCGRLLPDISTCIPQPGQRQVRCSVSKTSMFGLTPDPGPGGIVNEHDIYFVDSRTGKIAIQCLGGYIDRDTGVFEPTTLGLRRGITVLNGEIKENQDITLAMPLNKEGRIDLYEVPYYPSGITQPYLASAISLGEDGYLSLPVAPRWNNDSRVFEVRSLPESLTGDLFEASYSFYASLTAYGYVGVPYAVRMVSGVTDLLSDGVVIGSIDAMSTLPAPVYGDVVGSIIRPDGSVVLATSKGELLSFDGSSWYRFGPPDAWEGFTAFRKSASNPDGFVVGGSRGTVWLFSGTSWQVLETGFSMPVKSLWEANGTAVVLFQTALVVLDSSSASKVTSLPMGEFGRALWASDTDDVYVITYNYSTQATSVYAFGSQGWTAVMQVPDIQWYAIAGSGPDDVWLGGTRGTLAHLDGQSYNIIQLDTEKTITSLSLPKPGELLAAGEDGILFRKVGDAWLQVETDSLSDFTSADLDPVSGVMVAAGAFAYHLGPFMAFPRLLAPSSYSYFDFRSLVWDFWSADAVADYNYFILSNQEGYVFWLIMASGNVKEFKMPDLVQMLGVNLMPDGSKRINMTSSLAPGFSIDSYNNNDMNMYDKVSWSVDFLTFE